MKRFQGPPPSCTRSDACCDSTPRGYCGRQVCVPVPARVCQKPWKRPYVWCTKPEMNRSIGRNSTHVAKDELLRRVTGKGSLDSMGTVRERRNGEPWRGRTRSYPSWHWAVHAVVPISISWKLRRDRKSIKDRGTAHAVFYYIKGECHCSLGRGLGRDKDEPTGIWLTILKLEARD
jgi:hypothetical protein